MGWTGAGGRAAARGVAVGRQHQLRYLRSGLAALLVFTASKMLASEWVPISAGMSVAVIAGVLLTTIAVSVWQKSNASAVSS